MEQSQLLMFVVDQGGTRRQKVPDALVMACMQEERIPCWWYGSSTSAAAHHNSGLIRDLEEPSLPQGMLKMRYDEDAFFRVPSDWETNYDEGWFAPLP